MHLHVLNTAPRLQLICYPQLLLSGLDNLASTLGFIIQKGCLRSYLGVQKTCTRFLQLPVRHTVELIKGSL
ncbi:hypothetical protein BJX70DRAFT_354894 [Aspergillus crustosus]